MKKTSFQFFATYQEIQRFINHVLADEQILAYYVSFFPEYSVQKAEKNKEYDLSVCTFIIFSENQRELETEEDYNIYERAIYGDLILHVGKDNNSLLTESSIGAVSEGDINPKWVKTIRSLRKNCLKGGYIVTAKKYRQYYPKIMYLPGAQTAYFNGKTIRPFIGGDCVELVSEHKLACDESN